MSYAGGDSIMVDVKIGIAKYCFSQIYEVATEAVDLCELGNDVDTYSIMKYVDKIDSYTETIDSLVSDIVNDNDSTGETVINQEDVDIIINEDKKTSNQAYVDELNKTYDDFIEYSRQEDMRKTFNQGEGDG
jgi:hypothetical protein